MRESRVVYRMLLLGSPQYIELTYAYYKNRICTLRNHLQKGKYPLILLSNTTISK